MVLTKRIQTTLRSDTNPCARAEETGLQMGGRTASRLCPLCRQYRTAARRGLATSVPRCHDRFRRQFKKAILEIEVRGKRGTGYCKSMPGAVLPFKRPRRRCNQRHATEQEKVKRS